MPEEEIPASPLPADEPGAATSPLAGAWRALIGGRGYLYFLSAGVWVAAALLYSNLLPVFPIFILFMIAGVCLLPRATKRLR